MPSIKLNRQVFENLVGKKLPDKELREKIALLGTDLESVSEHEIDVEIFPNRPDMLSEQGFSRAFASFIGEKPGLVKYEVKNSGEKVIVDGSVKDVRPYTVCAIVKNLRFDNEKIKEIMNVQEKLHVTHGRHRKKVALGIYPLDKVKPPINYMADKPENIKFVPLEADQEMTGNEILEKHATGKQYARLLEGYEKFPFFKDSEGKILSMPPIINSHETGRITEDTAEVFIECSGYDYLALSRTLNIIVATLADMGGEIYSMEIEYEEGTKVTPNIEPGVMNLDAGYINKWLGLELSENEMSALLKNMGHDYENGRVYVPAYRTDILHQVDLAEDIAIAYGYDNFTAEIPKVATIGKEDEMSIYKRKISEILAGLGMVETKTYNLTSMQDNNEKMLVNMDCVELSNPTSSEYSVLRSWMIPSILDVFKCNKTNSYPQKVFDIGKCFKKDKSTETGVREFTRLCAGIASVNAGYTEILQVFDYLMRMLGQEYEVVEAEHPSFIKGRVGRVKVEEKKVAFIGELHPEVLTNFEMEMPVAMFELNLTDLLETFN